MFEDENERDSHYPLTHTISRPPVQSAAHSRSFGMSRVSSHENPSTSLDSRRVEGKKIEQKNQERKEKKSREWNTEQDGGRNGPLPSWVCSGVAHNLPPATCFAVGKTVLGFRTFLGVSKLQDLRHLIFTIFFPDHSAFWIYVFGVNLSNGF